MPRNAKSPQPPKLPRSPILRLEVRPCVSFLPRSLLSNDPTAMLRRDSPTAIRRARPTNPAPRSTTTFRGASRSLISAVVDDDVPWSVALGFCSAAFCRGAWVRVSSFDRAIYPGRRVLPRSTLSRSSFYGGVYPGRRRARPSALRLGPHGLPALQTQRQVPPKPPRFAAEPAFANCRANNTDRAAPRSVVVRGRVPQASPSRGTILAVRRE